MTDLETLTFNLQERQSPYFEQAELQNLLDIYGDVWTASYYGCLLKSQADNIKLPGGIEMPNNSVYWKNLAQVYLDKIPIESTDTVFHYKTSMARADGS